MNRNLIEEQLTVSAGATRSVQHLVPALSSGRTETLNTWRSVPGLFRLSFFVVPKNIW
jgi:hypothetical protein